jgi:hypothetical protein
MVTLSPLLEPTKPIRGDRRCGVAEEPVVQFQALYWLECECQGACGCEEDEEHVKRRWEAEVVEPPTRGVHVEECDGESCEGCWLWEIDGALPLFRWMVEYLAADGGAVFVNREMVDGWSRYQ